VVWQVVVCGVYIGRHVGFSCCCALRCSRPGLLCWCGQASPCSALSPAVPSPLLCPEFDAGPRRFDTPRPTSLSVLFCRERFLFARVVPWWRALQLFRSGYCDATVRLSWFTKYQQDRFKWRGTAVCLLLGKFWPCVCRRILGFRCTPLELSVKML